MVLMSSVAVLERTVWQPQTLCMYKVKPGPSENIHLKIPRKSRFLPRKITLKSLLEMRYDILSNSKGRPDGMQKGWGILFTCSEAISDERRTVLLKTSGNDLNISIAHLYNLGQ